MCLRICALTLLTCAVFTMPAAAQQGLVRNGGFEEDADRDGIPDGWAISGSGLKQVLTRDAGRDDKGFSAKLTCTEFADESPASHAMICQLDVASARRGKWYRLSFWARGEGIKGGVVQVALSNHKTWGNTGISDGVTVRGDWKRYEVTCQAADDVPADASRLQIWFRSTGTLWLDDLEMAEVDMKPQRHPQLATEGRTNFIPNAGFECGAAGWGSFSPDLRYWHGNVYRLIGTLDDKTAFHGRHSLRLDLSEKTLPTYYFDYFDPVRQPIRSLVAAHHGWLPAQPRQQYTLSAHLKADQPGRVGVLFVRHGNGRSERKDFPLTTEWQRCSLTFTPQGEYAWTGVGGDLAASKAEAATFWIDAVQLEKGSQATPYRPNRPLEVMLSTDAPGNVFEAKGDRAALRVQLHAANSTDTTQIVRATLTATDFYDQEAARRAITLSVPPRGGTTLPVELAVGRIGFFRVRLAVEGADTAPELRCAVLRPIPGADSRFGMNHAYPWDFLLPLAQRAGVRWWRDWTTQWRTVQPQEGAGFDFAEPDVQIDRVLRQQGKVLAMFPFPSAEWCSTADAAAIEKIARNTYEQRRVKIAFKPKDEPGFSRYVAESVRHFRDRVNVYQVFNEALYTSYSLPASGGHTMEDYIRLLRLAYTAVKAEQPNATVVAGPGIWANSHWASDFVEAGGLRYADVLDVHLYPRGDPEPYAESLGKLWQRMKERGEAKPIWLTELGCYADDDPAITPLAPYAGDAAMRNALHPDERTASEWLAKFSALFFANGGERIFLHAGTCGEINGVNTGGIFFEYGGAPRKMLAAVAVMAGMLPPTAKFEKVEELGGDVAARWFTTPAGRVGVAWSAEGAPGPIRLPAGARVLDLMGNPLPAGDPVGTAPVYIILPR